MQRRKLVIEKLIDGDVEFHISGKNEDLKQKFMLLIALHSKSEKFLIDTDALPKKEIMDNSSAIDQFIIPPYDNMWIESKIDDMSIVIMLSCIKYKDQPEITDGIPVNIRNEFLLKCDESNGKIIGINFMISNKYGVVVLPKTIMFPPKNMVNYLVINSLGETGLPKDTEGDLFRQFIELCFCAIASLNIKGLSTSTSVEPDVDLQKARNKRGKPPLFTYTYVKALSAKTPTSSLNQGTSLTKGFHSVRGHFKNINGDLRWWSAHFAGSGPLKTRRAYVVKS